VNINNELWRLKRVAAYAGVSARTILRDVERRAFPPPLRLRAGQSVRLAWRASEIVAHVAAAIAEAERARQAATSAQP
jgi:predicted DNA-binding transcriptional regulator AlpA